MTICIRKTTWPVACMALAIVILFSASAAMGAGGGAADGHVGGPGISDYTAGTGSQGHGVRPVRIGIVPPNYC
jgi:hypothetical protein